MNLDFNQLTGIGDNQKNAVRRIVAQFWNDVLEDVYVSLNEIQSTFAFDLAGSSRHDADLGTSGDFVIYTRRYRKKLRFYSGNKSEELFCYGERLF